MAGKTDLGIVAACHTSFYMLGIVVDVGVAGAPVGE